MPFVVVRRLSCRGVASARPGRQAASCPCIRSKRRNHLNSVCALTFFRLVGSIHRARRASLGFFAVASGYVAAPAPPRSGRGLSGAPSPERRRRGTIVGQALRPDSQSDEACKGWENVPNQNPRAPEVRHTLVRTRARSAPSAAAPFHFSTT